MRFSIKPLIPDAFENARILFRRELYDLYQSRRGGARWFLMRKLGRSAHLRRLVTARRSAAAARRAIPRARPLAPTLFAGIDPAAVVEALVRDGLFEGLQLPLATLAAIRRFATQRPCFGHNDPKMGFCVGERRRAEAKFGTTLMAASYFDVAASCPAIAAIERDAVLLRVVEQFMGTEPVHQGTRLRWSFATPTTIYQQFKDKQTFHYDLDDYCGLKFFFYVTDVDPHAGPHVCVLGSHRRKPLRIQLLRGWYSEEAIQRYYGSERVRTICGPAGYGFAEDSFCIHKGEPPRERDRLILKIEFAAREYGGVRSDRIATTPPREHDAGG